MNDVAIRGERPEDVEEIATLTRAAFAEVAYSQHNEADIVDALRADGALVLSLVAEDARGLAGHVAFSPVHIDGADHGWLGLGPLSVRPAAQRRGIGTALVEAAVDALRRRGTAGCVVLGDPAYYARFGFRHCPQLVLPGVPAEYFQALPLQGDLPEGDVRYHAAFGS